MTPVILNAMPQPPSMRSRARRTLRRVAAYAVTAIVAAAVPLFGAVTPARATTDSGDPLAVSIDTLTPSTVPKKGVVTVTGEITNDDTSTWTGINVYAFIGDTPITTPAELSGAVVAAEEDPTAPLGDRITEPGDYVTIPRLAPGASASYTLHVPRKDLPVSAPGVYWFGVHALGDGPDGRDTSADGRARTLLPLVPTSKKTVPEEVALVVPLRAHVVHETDGRLADLNEWDRLLGPSGRLTSALALGSGSQPVTWLLDPAVIDALRQLAAGNPPTLPTSTAKPRPNAPIAVQANAWLTRFEQYVPDNELMSLPYGDLDVDGAAARAPALYATARERSTGALAAAHLDATPVDAPITGYASAGALKLDSATPTIVSDLAVGGAQSPVAKIGGQPLYVASSGASSGGPGPDDPHATVSMRQRLLAEAAVRLGSTKPLIVSLPASWSTSDPAAFLSGLNVPWLSLMTLDAATAGITPARLPADQLQYDATERKEELRKSAFRAAQRLIDAGQTLQDVIGSGDLSTSVLDDALTTISYESRGARTRPAVANRDAILAALDSVTIQAPRGVTMSSARGSFSATVVNGLPVPITVQVEGTTDPHANVTAPANVRVPANGRSTVLLTATTQTNGVHMVTLHLTDAAGNPISTSVKVPVRSAQVSKIIWVFIAVGGGLLFSAIGFRLTRRIRRERRAKA